MRKARFTAIQKLKIINDFNASNSSLLNFSKQVGISSSTLRFWQDKYNAYGIKGLQTDQNQKYSKELKFLIVKEYLAGHGSLVSLSIKYGLRSKTQLSNWIVLYNSGKLLKDSPSRKKPTMSRKTTLAERKQITDYVLIEAHSYHEAAEKFQVSYQQVRNWVLKVKKSGYAALRDNRGRTKPVTELTELEKANRRIKELERELADQKLYDQFLKKLHELQRRG